MATLPFKEWRQPQTDKESEVSQTCMKTDISLNTSSNPDRETQPLSHDEIINRIRLYRTDRIGPVTYRNLLRKFSSATEAIGMLPELAQRGGRQQALLVASQESVEAEWGYHERVGARLIVEGNFEYPKILSQFEDSPPVLSVRGDIKLLLEQAVGIVGARNCSLTGKKMARSLARDLGDAGYNIISGLARGIDCEAHQASLTTGTLAVIAGGIDKVYPPEHEDLFRQISEQGLIIAESPWGVEPKNTLFPKRNRLISALSQGVVVIEAAMKSGSLITARYAADYNHDVFVVPGSPLDPRYSGSNMLIRNGAHLICDAQDVIQVLQEPYRTVMKEAAYEVREELIKTDYVTKPQGSEASREHMKDLADQVLSYLGPSPILLDDLLNEFPQSPADVLTVILELELAGRLVRHPGNKLST